MVDIKSTVTSRLGSGATLKFGRASMQASALNPDESLMREANAWL